VKEPGVASKLAEITKWLSIMGITAKFAVGQP